MMRAVRVGRRTEMTSPSAASGGSKPGSPTLGGGEELAVVKLQACEIGVPSSSVALACAR